MADTSGAADTAAAASVGAQRKKADAPRAGYAARATTAAPSNAKASASGAASGSADKAEMAATAMNAWDVEIERIVAEGGARAYRPHCFVKGCNKKFGWFESDQIARWALWSHYFNSSLSGHGSSASCHGG